MITSTAQPIITVLRYFLINIIKKIKHKHLCDNYEIFYNLGGKYNLDFIIKFNAGSSTLLVKNLVKTSRQIEINQTTTLSFKQTHSFKAIEAKVLLNCY